MGMRNKEDYSDEDLARIDEAISTGVHSTERKPFRFRLLFLWWIVVAMLGGISWFIAWSVGVV